VQWTDSAQLEATALFTVPGTYTLTLAVDDGVHPVAFDAVIVTVESAVIISLTRSGTNAWLRWSGGQPPFVVERSSTAGGIGWQTLLTTTNRSVAVPLLDAAEFFRVQTSN
jgi:hypothetical protein